MTEMSAQEAAAVWTQVPAVEQQLTARVAGMANILMGLAIASIALPNIFWPAAIDLLGGRQDWLAALALAVGPLLAAGASILLFLFLRDGVWNIFAAARPEEGARLFRRTGTSRWVTIAYLAAVVWWFLAGWRTIPDDGPISMPDTPLSRSANLVMLLLFVHTVSVGLWESKQWWSPRRYLLVVGLFAVAASATLMVAFPWGDAVAPVLLGLGWMLAGSALYRQV